MRTEPKTKPNGPFDPLVGVVLKLGRIRIKLTCNECGKSWKVSPNAADPQCPKCNGVDYEVSE